MPSTFLGHDRALLRQEAGAGSPAPKWGPVMGPKGGRHRAANWEVWAL